MKNTLRVAMGASVLALVLAACQPTGVPECDANAAALVIAENEGYRFDCDPDLPGAPPNVLGWTDHQAHVLYVWPDRMSDRATIKVMFHELGHVSWERQGRTGTQQAEETWADGVAWCRMTATQREGISFLSRPTNCAPYLA